MTEKFISINAARVVAGGTAVLSGIPNDSAMRAPRLVRVTATGNGCYIKFGVDATVIATANDIFIQAGDSGIFNVSGCKWFSVLQVSGGSNVSVAALEVGGFDTAATLDLRFTASDTLDSRVTFTRSSSATRFDSRGVMETVSSDAARFDYDPTTLAHKGLLIEEQRTNSIRNNTMVGAVAGTPGTLPTNWARFTSGTAATAVVGTGSESGIAYVDVRFTGANTDGISFFMDGTTGHAAANGQTWTGACYYRLTAGAITNATVNHAVYEANSSGTALASTSSSLAAVTSAPLAAQRISATRTNNNASTAEEQLAIVVAGTGNFDFTLRIGLPQLELGAFATSVIPTSGTAATRSADVATMTGANFSNWYNQTEGTFVAEAVTARVVSTAGTGVYSTSNAAANGSVAAFYRGSGATGATVDDVTSQCDMSPTAALAANAVFKSAFAVKANDFAVSGNGGAVSTDTVGTLPAMNQLLIGQKLSAAVLNGHIRRLSYFPRRLSNAELQGLTS